MLLTGQSLCPSGARGLSQVISAHVIGVVRSNTISHFFMWFLGVTKAR